MTARVDRDPRPEPRSRAGVRVGGLTAPGRGDTRAGSVATAARDLGRQVTTKTVVLTGALVPYTFGSSDGLFNLGTALAFAQTLPPGVYVAMNGRCFRWDDVRKDRSTGLVDTLGK
jgi:hypothetical protein